MSIAKKRMFLLFGAVLLLGIVVTTIVITYSWYVSSSNDAVAETDEMKTLAQGYGGHFSSEEEYTNFTGIYEHSETAVTKAYVKPGDVIYYSFLFDVDTTAGLKSAYKLELVLNAGSNTGTYHGVQYGNYNSLLSNLIIEENTCHLYQLEKTHDDQQNDDQYTTFNGSDYYDVDTDFTNTESTFYENNVAGASIDLQMPEITEYPDSEKSYFMIIIPIWYQDTGELQNNELECFVRLSSTIITEITA